MNANVMGSIRFFLAIAASGMLTACGGASSSPIAADPPTNAPIGSISGTVKFKGLPLAGVAVTAFNTRTNSIRRTTVTDSNGEYSFSGMETTADIPAEYHLWASKPGYGFYPSVRSGAKVMRANYTHQFAGNATTDAAVYFTVIDYVALPETSLSAANFSAYNGSNARVMLAATGQTVSYANGDDASMAKGVAWPGPRFADNQDGTVTDNLTGLTWLQDAACFPATIWSAAVAAVNQLGNGACGLNDGSTPGQWRLPNLNELESLVDVSASDPALSPNSPFVNISNGIYWSSTSYFAGAAGSPNAWAIRFSDGRYINDSISNAKANSNNELWAVRGTGGGATQLRSTGMSAAYAVGDDGSLHTGVPLTYPRWIDNRNGTLTDTVTGLIWLKQANCINGPWSAAIASVNALASGQCGLTDGSIAGGWRMPNRNEMLSLSDRMENDHATFFDQTYTWKANQAIYRKPVFTDFVASDYYWTSTTDAADPSRAWTIFSRDFGVYDTPKSDTGYTLAVR